MTSVPAPQINAIPAPARGGQMRAIAEAIICLYVAVILFRTFAIEGYIISTGSMAPSLLGFHKRVICPSCGYQFAFGIPVDAAGAAAGTHEKQPTPASQWANPATFWTSGHHEVARCPNCGREGINVDDVPPNHGDQLLVLKNVFEFRRPRRWEVVVLKNPMRPAPPFVKRVIGLPNESVQIIDGDIYVDGTICRKDLPQQRAVRIPVFDNDFVPTDGAKGHGCWSAEPTKTAWRAAGHGFEIGGADFKSGSDAHAATEWLTFHRWVRDGGTYKTEVPLDALASKVQLPRFPFTRVELDEANQRLVATGALSSTLSNRLLALNPDPHVRAAIGLLSERSHEGPITDDYGYNRPDAGLRPLAVRDILLQCTLAVHGGTGELIFEIGDGCHAFRLSIDRLRNEAALTLVGGDRILRKTSLAAMSLSHPKKLELSIFDRQVVAALDGAPLFPPWEFERTPSDPPRTPLRIGARDVSAAVRDLKVFRDVYYTRGRARNAVDRALDLAGDEYFLLGDNSPVSNDGRSWVEGAIKESLLVGRPLLVHLPSRPAELTFGGHRRYIRIPDFSRIRYIR